MSAVDPVVAMVPHHARILFMELGGDDRVRAEIDTLLRNAPVPSYLAILRALERTRSARQVWSISGRTLVRPSRAYARSQQLAAVDQTLRQLGIRRTERRHQLNADLITIIEQSDKNAYHKGLFLCALGLFPGRIQAIEGGDKPDERKDRLMEAQNTALAFAEMLNLPVERGSLSDSQRTAFQRERAVDERDVLSMSEARAKLAEIDAGLKQMKDHLLPKNTM